jgi:hypothetical protein
LGGRVLFQFYAGLSPFFFLFHQTYFFFALVRVTSKRIAFRRKVWCNYTAVEL